MTKGYIPEDMHDFGADEQVPSRFLDRLQEDDVLLNDALIDVHARHHYPQVHTEDYRVTATASADTVTIGDNILITVGGVTFDTHDLDSRDMTFPDNLTRYLRVKVDDDSGKIVNFATDPIERDIKPEFYVSDDDSASSAHDAILLKATKAGPGTTPVIEQYYTNNGHSHVIGAAQGGELNFAKEGFFAYYVDSNHLAMRGGILQINDGQIVYNLIMNSNIDMEFSAFGIGSQEYSTVSGLTPSQGCLHCYLKTNGLTPITTLQPSDFEWSTLEPTRDYTQAGLLTHQTNFRPWVCSVPYKVDGFRPFERVNDRIMFHAYVRHAVNNAAFTDEDLSDVCPKIDNTIVRFIAYGNTTADVRKNGVSTTMQSYRSGAGTPDGVLGCIFVDADAIIEIDTSSVNRDFDIVGYDDPPRKA